jgi:hypothetical protein
VKNPRIGDNGAGSFLRSFVVTQKNMHSYLALALVATTCGLVDAAPAQKGKTNTKTTSSKAKPQAKPQVKPQPKLSAPPLGMVPMAGVDGKIGQTYTLGGDNPINFTLNSAEFTLERVTVGTYFYAPSADEKLLVLRYTIHNPNKHERSYDWGTLAFTAVDMQNQNREYENTAGARQTGEALSVTLKPAQKVDGYTVIKVPAKGVIPKLIVKPDMGGVVRYDLRKDVKPLAAPIADPADATGATARREIPGALDQYYPAQRFDLKLVGTVYADALGEIIPEEGRRFFVATVSFRNATNEEASYDWGTFTPTLADADGEQVEWSQALLKANRNETTDGTLKPGQEYKARFYFALPKDVAAKTFTLAEGESHILSFDVSGTK